MMNSSYFLSTLPKLWTKTENYPTQNINPQTLAITGVPADCVLLQSRISNLTPSCSFHFYGYRLGIAYLFIPKLSISLFNKSYNASLSILALVFEEVGI